MLGVSTGTTGWMVWYGIIVFIKLEYEYCIVIIGLGGTCACRFIMDTYDSRRGEREARSGQSQWMKWLMACA